MPETMHEALKDRAERSRRSLNSEVLVLLERALGGVEERAVGDTGVSEGQGDARYDRTETPHGWIIRERGAAASGPPASAEAITSLWAERRQELRALGVRRIGLFGSMLRGTAGPASDVDVLVEFDPAEKTYDRFAALGSYLERLLGRPVDLVTTEGLSPFIGPRILEEVEFVAVGA